MGFLCSHFILSAQSFNTLICMNMPQSFCVFFPEKLDDVRKELNALEEKVKNQTAQLGGLR